MTRKTSKETGVKRSSNTLSRPLVTAATKLRLSLKSPPVSVRDVAAMLEIDLLLGDRKGFLKRLLKTLNAA